MTDYPPAWPNPEPGAATPDRPHGTFADLESMQECRKKAEGAHFLSYSVSSFTRDELLIALGNALQELDDERQWAQRDREMHEMCAEARKRL